MGKITEAEAKALTSMLDAATAFAQRQAEQALRAFELGIQDPERAERDRQERVELAKLMGETLKRGAR